MQGHRCGQCGGAELEWREGDELVCLHCRTRYRRVPRAQPRVVISKGANVIFGKDADVSIRGGLEIQEGANVKIEGKLEFELEVIELGEEYRA